MTWEELNKQAQGKSSAAQTTNSWETLNAQAQKDIQEQRKETPKVQEVQKPKYLGELLRSQPPVEKPKPTLSGRYVQDPTQQNVSIPFEKAPLKTQIENLTPEELRKMKTSELYELKRVAGMEEGDAKQWYSSLMAGFGDVADIVGSTMKWQGAEGGLIDRIGENLQEVGRATQSKYTDYEALEKLGEFDWGDMTKPSFWQNKAPRLLPFSMSLIPLAIIGGAAGTTIGASFGLGALVTTITGAIGGAVLSRPIEGMMEAGSTYDEAIKKGLSEEKAQEAANEVFIENLKQMSVLDVVQMLPFIKNIKGFKIPNSTANKIVNIVGTTGAVASEGFEEVLQNKIVSDALGEKFDLASPETKESFVLGTIMGGIFQGTGGIVNISQRAITNATKENLSKKNQAIFEKSLDKFMKEGETRSDSEALALNEVAKIDQKGLQDAITKALNDKSQELKDAGIEQQASTVLKEETPADKLSKQIKKSDPIDRLLATIEEQEVETKVEEPLVQEARKYKSAEEFIKAQQFKKIIAENPMTDSYHTGIRNASDIKTFEETLSDSESFVNPDFTKDMAEKALKSGEITIYSSKPLNKSISQFVTPSKMMASDYAGNRNIYSKKVNINDVAWISGDEGNFVGKSQLTDIWNKAQEKSTTKKQAPTIKKPTTKKKVKEVKPTEKEISKSVESIISLPRKEAIQKLQESIKENGFVKGGEEVLNKVATPTLNRGIDLEVFKRKPSILNLVKENVFTDSFILINDKEIAKKLYKEVKDKTGVEEDKGEPVIDWKQVVPEKWGNNEADIIGYENINEESWRNFALMVRLTDGETNTYVDANKLAFMKKQLPNAKMYLSGQNTPVVFIERGKVKGLLMPIKTSEDSKAKYQELGESTKLPDIQLKKDVVTKDMQGNKITLKEGEAFSVYELPKNRYLLEGKESYTVPKNQFQNIKGQSIIAEKKEFAPELEGTEETVLGIKKETNGLGEREKAKKYLNEEGIIIEEDMTGDVLLVKNEEYLDYDEDLTDKQRKAYDVYIGEAQTFEEIDKIENDTKFEKYVLPNGENYREVLIKAPKKYKGTESGLPDGYSYSTGIDGYSIINDKTKDVVSFSSISQEKALNNFLKDEGKEQLFKSAHWDEPNVLFHLRMNDRTYNGKKVSFMEEFQSDWAREGRDKGFSKNLPKGTENDIEIKFVKSNVPEGHDPKNYPGYYEAFDKRTGDFLGRGGTKPDLMERALEEINLTEGVPYNPLLKNWQVTAIKRALIESVDSDYFAWTNGEQQKARYKLSDEVDYIEWEKAFNKDYKEVSIQTKNGKTVLLEVLADGKIAKSNVEKLQGEKIDEALGKGLAEKVMKGEEGKISGEGLNIGGEWANSLYDIQAKKIVESLTGGKVEMIDLGLPIDKAGARFEIPKDNTISTSFTPLTIDKLKVGLEIRNDTASQRYIITDILGDGKFKAVPKQVVRIDSAGLDRGKFLDFNLPQVVKYKETFDISQKTTLQPALKLTPEIKAIIRGEAPQLKVEQKLYQTPSQGSQVLVETIQRITTQEALAQAQDFAIVRDTNIPIKAVETIIENPRAFGKYQKGTIEFIYNPDITTIPHEIGHYWFEAMLTKDQQTEVLREYKEWFIKNKPNKARPDTRNGWEEAMVQDMAKYYSKKYTKKKGKIERFWDWFIYQIKRVLNKNDFIARFTYDVRTKSIDRNVSKRKLADSLNQTGAIRTNGGIILPDETKGQAFRRKIQDINTRIDTTVRTLREGGVVIPESQDIFLAKTLLPRRIGGAIEKFANEVMNPFINTMAKDGVDLDNLNLYLHAMHAPERNRKMNELRKAENDKRNRQRVEPKPYFPVDGLSGMTDAEARSVINTFKEMGIASKLEEHRISLQKISKATLLFQLKEGLLSQEEYDAIRGSYENYVPLSRDIEDNAKGWGTGKGVNIKGKEVKRARGSQDLPVLPIVSQIFNRMNTAIVRAEKNRVALSVARLIKANPKIKTKTGKELWTIKSEKYIPRYDSFGEVEYVEPLGARSQKPNEIAFKYKGKQKYLVINDPLLVRALTDEGKSKPIPYLSRYTSLLSRLATQYNPEFLIRNFSRDISESLVNVSGVAENYLTKEDAKGLKSDILKSIPKLFGAIYGYKSRKESHGAKELIDEFIKNGGEVGYFWLEDEKTLDQRFKRQWRKSAPKGLSDKTKNQMSNFMDFVGNVNSTVELVTRVSVYKALRERGMSAKQSAQIAGDITVDFNKKGEWGALISSMYMFFNAAVQGAARVFRSIKSSKKVRVMAASLFIGGFLNGIISQLWGDGDDEDYDQFIPDYKKNTRIVFADPTGKEWTVFFLPYGFGFFWAAGRSFSEVVRGKKDILESSVNVTRAFVQSFLPIDVMGGWKEFVPSSVKPLVEVATNEAWYDAPIAPDQPAYQPKIPESQRYFKTASNMSKSLSTWLNSVTGGDENRSGIVDISPEFIDYLWQQYTSGAGSFIGNVAETGYGIVKGDVKKERIPFVRSFVADVKKESVIKSNVYDIIDEGARRIFNQDKKDKFYKQVDWLIKNGSLSEDEQENIDKGNELKINFLKAQYNFTLGDKISIVEAMDKMSEKDINIFFESLTPRQIKSIRTGK